MKAIVYHQYGSPDVLRYEEIEKPVPGDDEVLLKIRAASVNPFDSHFMRGEPSLARIMMGLRKPRFPRVGVDVAGVVEAVGRNVTRFKPGDEVFGGCRGSFAEYGCTPERALAIKPPGITFEQAAAVNVAGRTALQALRYNGPIQPGQKILINGAAGGVGTFAVQIAKSSGAEVTGVCSTRNIEMLRSIGAGHVIDYTREDFADGSERYDVIVDCFVNHSLSACRRVLSPTGTYVLVGGMIGRWYALLALLLKVFVLSRFVKQNLALCQVKRSQEDLATLAGLLEARKLTPVIDRRYPLNEVPQAMRYLEEGHARGKVIITVNEVAQ